MNVTRDEFEILTRIISYHTKGYSLDGLYARLKSTDAEVAAQAEGRGPLMSANALGHESDALRPIIACDQ